MIFATQQPRGIDNAIVSNCTTHVYGRVSSPTAIDAIKEMIAARGGAADDVARLSRGEFYFSTEGSSRPLKIQAPLCLSWHPANPPTAEEVAALARARAASGGLVELIERVQRAHRDVRHRPRRSAPRI